MEDPSRLTREFLEELGTKKTVGEIEELRVKYLGKKGTVTEKLKSLARLAPDERREAGRLLNDFKALAERELALKKEDARRRELASKLASEAIDVSLPGIFRRPGRLHPVTLVMSEIIRIFTGMGFTVEEGPEVELDHYNFEALNIPKEHPARDMQDTFYISSDIVLRTHTSPVQVRVLEKKKPPLRFIAPGKVYRCDADVSHTPMFHQIEGMMVGENVTFANLKAVLEAFLHKVFSPQVPVRFRPSYFPFTEPSAEVDIGCIFCGGAGCGICKGTGWIEILGSGMVNPRVFELAGLDPRNISGFAFGMGMERIAMLKYGIDDLRLFFENDIRFLGQF